MECEVALRNSIIQICLYISFFKKIDPRIPLKYLKYKCKLYVIRYGIYVGYGKKYNIIFDALKGYSYKFSIETMMFWENLERDILEEYDRKTSFSYLPKKAGLTVGAAGLAEYWLGSAFPVASLATGAAVVGYRSWYRSYYTELNLEAKLEIILHYCAIHPDSPTLFGSLRQQVENRPEVLLPYFQTVLQKCFDYLEKQKTVPEYKSVRKPSIPISTGAKPSLPEISLGLFDDVIRQRVPKKTSKRSGKSEVALPTQKYGVELSLSNRPPPGVIQRIFYSSQSSTIGVLEYQASQITNILSLCPNDAQKTDFQDVEYIYPVLAASRDFNGVKFEGSNMCRLKFLADVGPYFAKTERKVNVTKTKAGQAPRIVTAPVYEYVGDKKH